MLELLPVSFPNLILAGTQISGTQARLVTASCTSASEMTNLQQNSQPSLLPLMSAASCQEMVLARVDQPDSTKNQLDVINQQRLLPRTVEIEPNLLAEPTNNRASIAIWHKHEVILGQA